MEVTKPKIRNCEQHKKPNMKKKGNYANNDYFNKLSVDVITSIFIRCPVKALSLLRCVSKLWNDLIISPSFIHSHRKQSMENAPKLLFVEGVYLSRPREYKLRFVSVNMEAEEESNEELWTVTSNGRLHTSREWLACSGLICLSIDHRMNLCNLATQQVCQLPIWSPSSVSGYNLVGFGYLHPKKEYKVVHFFYRCPPCHFRDLQVAQLKSEVLTVSEVGCISNRWKEIEDRPLYHPDLTGLLVNECMYWFAKLLPDGQCDRIISFDFEKEKFLTISCPSCFETLCSLKLMDLKGMLCLPDTLHFRRSSILDLWILEDKISCTWVKEYSVNLVNFGFGNIAPFFRTWNGDIIFRHLDTVVCYDLKGKRVRRVKRCPEHWFGIYWESLFSLGNIDPSIFN